MKPDTARKPHEEKIWNVPHAKSQRRKGNDLMAFAALGWITS